MSQNPIKSKILNVQPKNTNQALASLGAGSTSHDENLLHIEMPLEILACSPGYKEFWGDDSQISSSGDDQDKNMSWVNTEHHLLISFEYADSDLNEVVSLVYQHAYELSEQFEYKYLLRTWNYIDQINTFENDQERYQTFCVARHEVLARLNKLETPNPAATAIGGVKGQNCFVFLFSRQSGNVVENKRQISAWRYPEKYAPKQPRFSRAMQYGGMLMCSGTASVLGHETIHLNNLKSQLDECLINIEALIEESDLDVILGSGMFRFYLRDKAKLSTVLKQLEKHGINQYVVVEGDVCRDNLLIECEAVFQ